MVRPRGVTRTIGNTDEEKMAAAVNLILKENHSIRQAAREMGIKHLTSSNIV